MPRGGEAVDGSSSIRSEQRTPASAPSEPFAVRWAPLGQPQLGEAETEEEDRDNGHREQNAVQEHAQQTFQ
jgi:hypothetical protein